MKKQPILLFSLLFCRLAFSASAQNNGLITPVAGTKAYHNQPTQRPRKPESLPMGGFWVTEANSQKNSSVIIHHYEEQQREVHTDTRAQKRLKLESRTVVRHLSERLAGLLQTHPRPIALIRSIP